MMDSLLAQSQRPKTFRRFRRGKTSSPVVDELSLCLNMPSQMRTASSSTISALDMLVTLIRRLSVTETRDTTIASL